MSVLQNDAPPVTAVCPQLTSRSTKRNTLFATLERTIEKSIENNTTHILNLLATHLRARTPAQPVVEVPRAESELIEQMTPATPASAATVQNHSASAAVVASPAPFQEEMLNEEPTRTAVALCMEEQRQEIARAIAAGQQLSQQQLAFLSNGKDQAGQANLDLPPPPPLPPPPTCLGVSLGPDLHLDLTNLSASRGARIQLPNPEPFDGNLRKLVPDVYRTPADYVYALASTAIRSDVPLPEITKTFFKGTAKTWQHQIWIEVQTTSFPHDPHCLTDPTYTKRLAAAFLLKFEMHFATQLRQRSTVAMEAFLSEAYHQRPDESVALYFARFYTKMQEAGGFTESQKVLYFRAGLHPDIRKYSVVNQDGKEFDLLTDIFQHALAQERRASAFFNRPTIAVTQPSLAYMQSGHHGHGGGRSGRDTRAGGHTHRNGGGRRDRHFTDRERAGVQRHTAPYRDEYSNNRAQGHMQRPAQGFGQAPPTTLAAAPPGMT